MVYAREFIRILDTLYGDKILKGGTKIGDKKGKIRIVTEHLLEPEVKQVFTENRPDHRILSVAYYLSKKGGGTPNPFTVSQMPFFRSFISKVCRKNKVSQGISKKQSPKNRQVILVSKDVNLRLKAKSLGIVAQDYSTDRIQDINGLYSGKRILLDFPDDMISHFYQSEEGLDPTDVGLHDLHPHEYFILKNGRKSTLAYHNPDTLRLERIEKKYAYNIKPRNAEQTFALHALTHPGILLVTLMGKAGTGKTLLALAAALQVRKQFKQIYLARPIIPLSNRDLGYLPGDIEAKLDPFMQPLYDNLAVIKNQFNENSAEYKRITEMLENQKLHITPLSYIRGRSLERIFFIVDEAQNLTPHEVKTIITRAGEGTKIVFTGDPYQIDTPYLDARSTGLTYLIHRMKGQKIYAHITLEKGERSMLAELASDLL